MNKVINKLISMLSKDADYKQEMEAIQFINEELSKGNIIPKYSEKFETEFKGQAITLPVSSICDHYKGNEIVLSVFGRIHEDYYKWVNFFVAVSPNGKDYIFGDFQKEIYYSSKKFKNLFDSKVVPYKWDYGDI